MRAAWIGGPLLLLAGPPASQTPAPAAETRLAEIPAGLALAGDHVPRSNRGAFVERTSIAWSADGRSVAYAAKRGEEYLPVVGDRVGEIYTFASRPILAGGHAFFGVARCVTESTARCWLWVDGATIGPEDWIGDLGVSPDGRQVAFWTHPGAKYGNSVPATSTTHRLAVAREGSGGRWSVTRGKTWFENPLMPPVFRGGGDRVLTCAIGSKGWVALQVTRRGETERSEPHPTIDAVAASGDGDALVFVRSNAPTAGDSSGRLSGKGTELYFKGKRVGRANDGIAMPTVDERGQHVAYGVEIGAKRAVAIDEEKPPAGLYDFLLELAFDPKGERLAFVVNVGGKDAGRASGVIEGGDAFVVVRPVSGSGEPVEHPRFREVRDLVWDLKGERLAYCGRDESGWRIVCGEARSDAHDDVGPPHFAADGSSIGFGSRNGRVLWWRVLGLP